MDNNMNRQQSYCHRCKAKLEEGVCPVCGYRAYKPMDAKKARKIKWITTIVGMVILVAHFVVLQIVKN